MYFRVAKKTNLKNKDIWSGSLLYHIIQCEGYPSTYDRGFHIFSENEYQDAIIYCENKNKNVIKNHLKDKKRSLRSSSDILLTFYMIAPIFFLIQPLNYIKMLKDCRSMVKKDEIAVKTLTSIKENLAPVFSSPISQVK